MVFVTNNATKVWPSFSPFLSISLVSPSRIILLISHQSLFPMICHFAFSIFSLQKDRKQTVDKFLKLGIPCEEADVVGSAFAAAAFVKTTHPNVYQNITLTVKE